MTNESADPIAPLDRASSTARRAFAESVRAWGGRGDSAALEAPRAMLRAKATPDLDWIHPTWLMRALQDESPAVRAVVAAHGPQQLEAQEPGRAVDGVGAVGEPLLELLAGLRRDGDGVDLHDRHDPDSRGTTVAPMPNPGPTPTLQELVDLVHGWYPPATADSWDRVGLVHGDLDQPVRRVLLAVERADGRPA